MLFEGMKNSRQITKKGRNYLYTIYGYIRVFSTDQNEDRQLIALRGRGYRISVHFKNLILSLKNQEKDL